MSTLRQVATWHPVRTFWGQPWGGHNTALPKCGECELGFALYDCECVKLTLPDFEKDPKSTSCRVWAPEKYKNPNHPKPTTRPEVWYERKVEVVCGNTGGRCLYKGVTTGCPQNPRRGQRCETTVTIHTGCTHATFVRQKCRHEEHRLSRRELSSHLPDITDIVRKDGFCNIECAQKQHRLDKEQEEILKEKQRAADCENSRWLKWKLDQDRQKSRGTSSYRQSTHESGSGPSRNRSDHSYRHYTDDELRNISQRTDRERYQYR